MLLIDQYAYANKLSKVHPGEKMMFSILTMLIGLMSGSVGIQMLLLLIMIVVTLYGAGIPWRVYLGLFIVPLSFIALGIVPIVFEVAKSGAGLIYSLGFLDLFIGLSKQGVPAALNIVSRSIMAVSCLYFLIFTTSMVDMMEQLRKVKIPNITIELMMLIYRFIFVLLEAAALIHHSQSARLGYSNVRSAFSSLARLSSMIFVRSIHNSRALGMSLASRGYSGDLRVLTYEYNLNRRNIALITLLEILLVVLCLYREGI